MLPLPIGGPAPDERSPRARAAIERVRELLSGRREQLVHDLWTVRAVFASPGHLRRAGFHPSVLARALAAELQRVGTQHEDPLDEAFWLLTEQPERLNWRVVDARASAALWRARGRLLPSQQRACTRLFGLRSAVVGDRAQSPSTNALLLAILAGSLQAHAGSPRLRAVLDAYLPEGPQFHARDEVEQLLLPLEVKQRLDERADALDRPTTIAPAPAR